MTTTNQQEMTVKDAENILRQSYWDAVRSIADDLKDEVEAGNVSGAEEADEWIHETVGGSQWVIYTRQNYYVLLFSDNDSAYADDFGEDGLVKDGNVSFAALAYWALRADVMDMIGDLDDLFTSDEDDDTEE